ncbi:hypothetical protein ACIRPT_26240 [Streptomyces sp. NPDC101227]|uniref:hypothetical protein n=1 Tax=Streptomyces sp. NPDC101227 TaxID=3366136 RepID=UPI0038048CCD
MSHTELERLAKIRMQITGETLERAMAVLEGHATEPEPEPETTDEPGERSAAERPADEEEPRPRPHLRSL